jgi:hypothetical protein
MLAVRPRDVERPSGVPEGVPGDGSALVVGRGAGQALRSGERAVFCQVVTIAPVHRHRDGRLTAVGRVADHARLGVLEEQVPPGLLDQLAVRCAIDPPERDRVMSLGFTLRCVLMMTLLPDAGYREVTAVVAGQLPALPWRRRWQLPGGEVLARWRIRLRPRPLEELFWQVAGPIADPDRVGMTWRGLSLCAIDGFQTRTPDTGANRQEFGSSGTADDSAPFPQIRAVIAITCGDKGTLGAALEASQVGEQALTEQLADTRPEVFTRDRVFLVDRNYLGFPLIIKILSRGSHLLMRIKAGIKLPVVRWLPDGSYLSYLTAPGGTSVLPIRVVEYDVALPGQGGVSELFCLATDLLDHYAYPAGELRDAYPHRWRVETLIGENKKTITDAGPSRGPILRSTTPAGIRQEFWAWLTATQLLRKAGHATTTKTSAVTETTERDDIGGSADLTGRISFTAIRREIIRAVQLSTHTAQTSANAAIAAAERFGAHIRRVPLQIGRDRHRPRVGKWQPRFPAPKGQTATTSGRLATVVHAPAATPTAPSSG